MNSLCRNIAFKKQERTILNYHFTISKFSLELGRLAQSTRTTSDQKYTHIRLRRSHTRLHTYVTLLQDAGVPFGYSLLQLSEEVVVEFVELREVVQNLVEKTLLDHRFATLTRCCGYGVTEVLWIRGTDG